MFAEDDSDSGFDSKGMADSRSPSVASTVSLNASLSSMPSIASEKSNAVAEDQTKKKGIPLTVTAQVVSSSFIVPNITFHVLNEVKSI